MKTRGKFQVVSIKKWSDSPAGQVELFAVTDNSTEENRRFNTATPSGNITMTINNPAAFEQFTYGREFYVDFTPVEDEHK